MKKAGKKVGIMPPSKNELDNPAQAQRENSAPDNPKMKKTGKTDGKSNKLGGGGRFQQMLNKGKSPALAAYIGRKMYGKKKMSQLSSQGHKSK